MSEIYSSWNWEVTDWRLKFLLECSTIEQKSFELICWEFEVIYDDSHWIGCGQVVLKVKEHCLSVVDKQKYEVRLDCVESKEEEKV